MGRKFWTGIHSVYFIGIGGISMSGLAHYLHMLGFFVAGSDVSANEETAKLAAEGIRVYRGHKAGNLREADAVVVGSAIPENNPELCKAHRLGIPVYGRADLLAAVLSSFDKSVGIAGSHGKTTATAMCAHVMQACSGRCTAHIGGEDIGYGNFFVGGDKYFVTEACEYKGNFLKLKPDVAVILNTDKDHMECYGSEEKLLEAYAEFAYSANTAIVCGEDRIARELPGALKFGLMRDCDIFADDIRTSGGKYSFTLCAGDESFERIRLNVYGLHNIYNALAAASVAFRYGYPPVLIAEGLREFRGIRRRFEFLGKMRGAEFIADYAHHPREIAAALRTAGEVFKGRLFVIFQPHTYSRTKLLFSEFVSVLKDVENLVIYKTYPAREYFDAEGSALTLSEHLPNSLYIDSVRELEIYLRCSLASGDCVLFLGAGDIYFAAKQLLLRQGTC